MLGHVVDSVIALIGVGGLVAGVLAAVTGEPGWFALAAALGYAATLAVFVWNVGHQQGATGQSFGRKVAGTRLVRVRDGRPVGFWLSIGGIVGDRTGGLCPRPFRPSVRVG